MQDDQHNQAPGGNDSSAGASPQPGVVHPTVVQPTTPSNDEHSKVNTDTHPQTMPQDAVHAASPAPSATPAPMTPVTPPASTEPTEPVTPQPTMSAQPAAPQAAQGHPATQPTTGHVTADAAMTTGVAAAATGAAAAQAQPATPQQHSMPIQRKGMPKIAKIAIFGVLGLVLVGLGLFLIFNVLLSDDSKISVSDLTTTTAEGMTFSHPSQWTAVDFPDGAAFTDGGESVEDSSQGVVVNAQSLGIDFTTLSDEQKALITTNFEDQFADPTVLEGDGCSKVENIQAQAVDREGYNVAFKVDATCVVTANDGQQARTKFFFGITGSNIHTLGVVGLLDTWDSSSEALDTIVDTVKPAL